MKCDFCGGPNGEDCGSLMFQCPGCTRQAGIDAMPLPQRTIYKMKDIIRNFSATFACTDTIREARNKAAKL